MFTIQDHPENREGSLFSANPFVHQTLLFSYLSRYGQTQPLAMESVEFNDCLDTSKVLNNNSYDTPPSKPRRLLENSPTFLPNKTSSTNVTPVKRRLHRLFSEDLVGNNNKKEPLTALIAFHHVLQMKLEKHMGSEHEEKVKQEWLELPILLVDDNHLNLKILEKMLRNFGFKNIKKVDNGKEAIRLCKKSFYDVIFMDGEMPEMNGEETILEIRKYESGFNLQSFIIIQSTASFDQIEKLKKAAGEYSTVIDKPYKNNSLMSAFKQLSSDLEKMILGINKKNVTSFNKEN